MVKRDNGEQTYRDICLMIQSVASIYVIRLSHSTLFTIRQAGWGPKMCVTTARRRHGGCRRFADEIRLQKSKRLRHQGFKLLERFLNVLNFAAVRHLFEIEGSEISWCFAEVSHGPLERVRDQPQALAIGGGDGVLHIREQSRRFFQDRLDDQPEHALVAIERFQDFRPVDFARWLRRHPHSRQP